MSSGMDKYHENETEEKSESELIEFLVPVTINLSSEQKKMFLRQLNIYYTNNPTVPIDVEVSKKHKESHYAAHRSTMDYLVYGGNVSGNITFIRKATKSDIRRLVIKGEENENIKM